MVWRRGDLKRLSPRDADRHTLVDAEVAEAAIHLRKRIGISVIAGSAQQLQLREATLTISLVLQHGDVIGSAVSERIERVQKLDVPMRVYVTV